MAISGSYHIYTLDSAKSCSYIFPGVAQVPGEVHITSGSSKIKARVFRIVVGERVPEYVSVDFIRKALGMPGPTLPPVGCTVNRELALDAYIVVLALASVGYWDNKHMRGTTLH